MTSNINLDDFQGKVFENLDRTTLQQHILKNNEGVMTNTGAINILTGKFTGRSPKDKFIVLDAVTEHSVDWGEINQPISAKNFQSLKTKMISFLADKDLYIQDASACSDEMYRLDLRLYAQKAYSAFFASNMFMRLKPEELEDFSAEWTILCAPDFEANALLDGTRQENFTIVNFSTKEILIGGSGYTGEIKKSIFSVLNFTLPTQEGVLSMHCSANIGRKGETSVFFGLSGTGKTTLSADENRRLIGDDEHGWGDYGVFNFEGGCYAKCVDLTSEKEPQIYAAIKEGALLENLLLDKDNGPDFADTSITQNTRVSYPIYHIEAAKSDSKGGYPSNIFFLACDAFGVLPPLSKLTTEQAMYHFISGYTAKIAGTEEGIKEPLATFSACFGAPFLPLHPFKYAKMLGDRIEKHNVSVWLVNTGWSGGAYGEGERISLKYTRRMISAVHNNEMDDAGFISNGAFNLNIPTEIEGVPSEILNPRMTWTNKDAYDSKENTLVDLYLKNFEKYEALTDAKVLAAAPKQAQEDLV